MPTSRTARPSTAPTAPWGILLNKKDAKLAGSHIVRGDVVGPANRSRYNGASAETLVPLGLGYVEAVLAALYGVAGVISYDPPGLRGRATLRSSGGPIAYHFAWRQEGDTLLIGGFEHSDGQATYQAALVALVALVVQHRASPSSQTEELVERWFALIDAMEAAHPRANRDAGWSRAAIGAACGEAAIRAHIERVCDSLAYAMRYRLPPLADGKPAPALAERAVLVQRADPLGPAEGSATSLPGAILINPETAYRPSAPATAPTAPTAEPPAAPMAAPAAEDDGDGARPGAEAPPPPARESDGAAAPAGAPAAPAPAANPPDASAAPPPPAPAAPRFHGGNAARVERALQAARGPLFLVGPTSTGKTSLAIRAAEQLSMGVELLVCDPGMDAQEPFGGYARRTSSAREVAGVADAAEAASEASPPTDDSAHPARLPAWAQGLFDRISAVAAGSERVLAVAQARIAELETRAGGGQGDWEAIDGPIARWARRAIGGERVLLIIDELARAHESCVSAVMRVLNTYDRATVEKQGLRVPEDAGAEEQFHIVDVWTTRERLVVPAGRVKVIATANIGDRYLGLDLSDPAFRRRWTGGWLHLSAYDAPTAGQILADRLGLPVGAPLITKLTAVAALVEQEQRSEDRLLSTLDLATLIIWGQLTIRLAEGGMGLRPAWETAAADVWVERICPLKGAELDPEVRSKLASFVSLNAPATIR